MSTMVKRVAQAGGVGVYVFRCPKCLEERSASPNAAVWLACEADGQAAPISPIRWECVWKSELLEQEPSHKLSPNEH